MCTTLIQENSTCSITTLPFGEWLQGGASKDGLVISLFLCSRRRFVDILNFGSKTIVERVCIDDSRVRGETFK